jgi:hypothetical protein
MALLKAGCFVIAVILKRLIRMPDTFSGTEIAGVCR